VKARYVKLHCRYETAIADYRGDRRPSLNLTRFARRLTAAAY